MHLQSLFLRMATPVIKMLVQKQLSYYSTDSDPNYWHRVKAGTFEETIYIYTALKVKIHTEPTANRRV